MSRGSQPPTSEDRLPRAAEERMPGAGEDRMPGAAEECMPGAAEDRTPSSPPVPAGLEREPQECAAMSLSTSAATLRSRLTCNERDSRRRERLQRVLLEYLPEHARDKIKVCISGYCSSDSVSHSFQVLLWPAIALCGL